MDTTPLIIDGLVIIIYFVTVTAIGLYLGRKEESLEDYALGGRKIPWWAVMASIIAAETSAATFIGVPAEGYTTRSVVYVQLAFGLILGRILVGQIFLKPYFTYKVYTVYDFLTIRFGIKSKNYISALFLIMRTLASGVRLYVPSLVLVLAWRLFVLHEPVQYKHLDSVAPYAWAIIMLTIVTCIYTTIGGIKAVVWTDVIQATIMFLGAIVSIVTIFLHLGDGSLIEGGRVLAKYVPEMTTIKGYFLTGFEGAEPGIGILGLLKLLFANPYTIPAAIIAGTFGNMAAFGTDQDMVQRMLTATDYKKSRRSLITAALMDVPIYFFFSFIGVLLIPFFELNPSLKPAKPNDVFGVYILNVMPVVVRGFVLAGVFATAMGSLSAALNALATSMTNDWYIPYFGKGKSQKNYVTAARFFTAFFAIMMILIACTFAYANVKMPTLTIIPVALGIAGYILGPMLGVFLIGMLTKTRGSDRGNLWAVTVGLLSVLLISGKLHDFVNWILPAGYDIPFPSWLPKVKFTWFVMVGSIATFIVGVLFKTPPEVVKSALKKAESSDTEKK